MEEALYWLTLCISDRYPPAAMSYASDIMAKQAQANDKIHWMLNYTPVKSYI